MSLLAVGCHGTAKKAKPFTFEESTWECEPERPNLLNAEVGKEGWSPRIEPGCKYQWAPDARPIWFHTAEESLRTYSTWKDVGKDSPGDHIRFVWQADIDTQLSELEQIVDRPTEPNANPTSPKHGLFWGVSDTFTPAKYTHVFECTPYMLTERFPLYKSVRPTWKVGKGYWTCRFGLEGRPSLSVVWVDESGNRGVLPQKVDQWRQKAVKRLHQPKLPKEDRPFDYYANFKRFYYLESKDRYWETTRVFDRPLSTVPYKGLLTFDVHWEYRKK